MMSPDGATTWPPSASQACGPAQSEPDWIAKALTLRRLEAAFSAFTLASLLALATALASVLA